MAKKAGIIMDSWKLKYFEKALEEAGYEYEILPGVDKYSVTLKFDYEMVADIMPIVEKASEEAKKHKGKK